MPKLSRIASSRSHLYRTFEIASKQFNTKWRSQFGGFIIIIIIIIIDG